MIQPKIFCNLSGCYCQYTEWSRGTYDQAESCIECPRYLGEEELDYADVALQKKCRLIMEDATSLVASLNSNPTPKIKRPSFNSVIQGNADNLSALTGELMASKSKQRKEEHTKEKLNVQELREVQDAELCKGESRNFYPTRTTAKSRYAEGEYS